MQALLILGNQLFNPLELISINPSINLVFMREDYELCTYYKHHKQKIRFFLSAMRKYKTELQEAGFKVHYELLSRRSENYEKSLETFLRRNKITELSCFEIEDKFFERRVTELCKRLDISLKVLKSPMFLCSRDDFKAYLSSVKSPFMKTFYERQRKKLKILVDKKGGPMGGQWSFDKDNRKPLPKNYQAPNLASHKPDLIDIEVSELVQSQFSSHPGSLAEHWLPTDRPAVHKWLDTFLKERFYDFGPYEDALSSKHPFLNHSILSPYLNSGLLTPKELIDKTLNYATKHKIPLNSLEGFVRQVIGWREFIRGIYQNFNEKQENTNFWKHTKKLSNHWYEGNTRVPPLDEVIQKTKTYAYAHHIERLMVVGSLMLLLEVHPLEAHRWFMEMFIDSSDWVMGPNVFGMALFSDGGVFATKPYICGSNYYRKMGGYQAGSWTLEVDGLYWSFIDKHRSFFSRNPRLSMMVKTYDKMNSERKAQLLEAAKVLKKRLTTT